MLGVQERLPRCGLGASWSSGRAASSPGYVHPSGTTCKGSSYPRTGWAARPPTPEGLPSSFGNVVGSLRSCLRSSRSGATSRRPPGLGGGVERGGFPRRPGQVPPRGPFDNGKWRVCFRSTDLGLRMRRAPRQSRVLLGCSSQLLPGALRTFPHWKGDGNRP